MTIKLTKADLKNRVAYVNGKRETEDQDKNLAKDFFAIIAKYGENIKSIEIKQKSIDIEI